MRRHVILRGYITLYVVIQYLHIKSDTSPRVASRVCVIGGSCTNCGVIRESDGLCARCLDHPYVKYASTIFSFFASMEDNTTSAR